MAACISCEIFTLFDAAQASYGERAYTALWPSIKNAFDIFVGVSLCFYFLRMIATGNAAFSEGVFQFLIFAFCAQTISSSAFFNEWIINPVRTFMFNGAELLMSQASVAGYTGNVSGVLKTTEANLLCVVNLGLQFIRDGGTIPLSGTVAAVIMGFPYLVALILFLLLLAEVLVVLFIVKTFGPMLIAFLAFKPVRSISRNGARMLGQAVGAMLITSALMGLMMGLLGTFMRWVPGSCAGGWRGTSGFIWSEGYIGLVVFGYFMLLMLLKAQGWAGQLVEFHGNSAAQMAGAAGLGKLAMTAASGAMGAAKMLGSLNGSVNHPREWGRDAGGGLGGGGGGGPALPGPDRSPPSIAPPASSVKLLGNGPLDWQGPFPYDGGGRSGGGPRGGPSLGGGFSPALPPPARMLPAPGGTPSSAGRALPSPSASLPSSGSSPTSAGNASPASVGALPKPAGSQQTQGSSAFAPSAGPAGNTATPGTAGMGRNDRPAFSAGPIASANGRNDGISSARERGSVTTAATGSVGEEGSRTTSAKGGMGSSRVEDAAAGFQAGPSGRGDRAAGPGPAGRPGDAGIAVSSAGGMSPAPMNARTAGAAGSGQGGKATEQGGPADTAPAQTPALAEANGGNQRDGGRGFSSARATPQGPRAGGGGYGARITNGVGVAEVLPPKGAPVRSQYTRRWR